MEHTKQEILIAEISRSFCWPLPNSQTASTDMLPLLTSHQIKGVWWLTLQLLQSHLCCLPIQIFNCWKADLTGSQSGNAKRVGEEKGFQEWNKTKLMAAYPSTESSIFLGALIRCNPREPGHNTLCPLTCAFLLWSDLEYVQHCS